MPASRLVVSSGPEPFAAIGIDLRPGRLALQNAIRCDASDPAVRHRGASQFRGARSHGVAPSVPRAAAKVALAGVPDGL